MTTDLRREIYVHIRVHLHDMVNPTRVGPRWLMGGGFNSVSAPAPLARSGLGCRRSSDGSRGRHSTTSSIQHTTAFVIVELLAWIMTSGVELGHGVGADRKYDSCRWCPGVVDGAEGRGRVVAGATWDRVKFIVGVDMGQQSWTRQTRTCSWNAHCNNIRLGTTRCRVSQCRILLLYVLSMD